MASKYHITTRADGTSYSAPCVARVRACPVGGGHYASKAEADMHLPEPLYAVDSTTGALRNATPAERATYEGPSAERMQANEDYAKFLQDFEAKNGKSNTANYYAYTGRSCSRAEMLGAIEELEGDIHMGDINPVEELRMKEEVESMRHDLYAADAAALRRQKADFHAANKAYRAERGPVVRPDFSGIINDAEAKKLAKANALEDAQARETQLAQIAEARKLREKNEDVISLFGKSKRRAQPSSITLPSEIALARLGEYRRSPSMAAADHRDERVPAARVAEFVSEASETIGDFFADAGDSVRGLFGR